MATTTKMEEQKKYNGMSGVETKVFLTLALNLFALTFSAVNGFNINVMVAMFGGANAMMCLALFIACVEGQKTEKPKKKEKQNVGT